MTVDITQEEMNILNLNGISADEVRANVEFSRASGLDDNTIRQQFTDTINELKPFTKQTYNDTKKIQDWQKKGSIAPYEYAQRKSFEYNGTYDNVIQPKKQNAGEMNAFGKTVSSFADRVTKPIKDITPDFVKKGLKKVGNTLNDMGESSYQAQISSPDDVVSVMSKLPNLDERTGEIGFQEGLARSYISGEWIPFVGGFIGGYDTKKEHEIREKIRNGEAIRQDELNFLNHRLDVKNEENVRGYTLGGNMVQSFLPSIARLALEMGTGSWVLEGLGWTGKAAEGANLLQKVGTGLKDMALTGAVNTVLPTTWNETYNFYQNRMDKNTLEFTDKGSWIFKESQEKPATAFMKSLAETFVMFSSETSGQLLGIPVKGATGALSKYVTSPIGKYLQSNKQLVKLTEKVLPEFSKLYEKMNNLPIKGQNFDWLKSRVKFDGFFEELGEEAVEDVLNLTLGTTGEKRSLENYAKAIFKSPDEWAVIAGAIALQGGTLSVASHILGSHMEQNGATNDEIIETLNNLSENEKEQKVQELIQDGLLNVSGVNETTQAVNNMTDDFYRKAVNAGITESQALSVSSLYKTMLESLGTNTEAIKNWHNNNEIMKNISVENAAKLLKGSVEYNEIPDNVAITQRGKKLNNEYRTAVRNFEQVKSDFDNGKISFDDYQNAEAELAAATENYNSGFAEINNTSNNKQYFQSAATAGAKNSADYSAAQKEWNEKGTESTYFKKWFGDSKVVNESGKPLVVYHGSRNNFKVFAKEKGGQLDGSYNSKVAFFFTNDKESANRFANIHKDNQVMDLSSEIYFGKGYNNPQNKEKLRREIANIEGKKNNVYSVFLSIKKPLIIDFKEDEYSSEKMDELVKQAVENGNDGLIIRDIVDEGLLSDQYVVFNPEQIKSVDNQGTFDSENPNIYYQKNSNGLNYNSFEDFEDEFKNDIEKAPADYTISNTDEALKDLGITENTSRIIETPTGQVEVRADRIEHIINGGGDGHQPDKTRYKSINKMFATLERPNIVTIDDNGKKSYFKLFRDSKKSKAQVAFIYNDENGDFVYTSMPVGKNKTYLINQLNKGNVIYKMNRPELKNNSAVNNIITDNVQNFNPDDKNLLMTHAMKIGNLDRVLETGSLIAPSFAVTKKNKAGAALRKFGDLLFIRKADKIDWENDNIYDRDIYSPRMPQPWYETKSGRVIDSYEYENMERMWKNKPERFEEIYRDTFDNIFDGAEKKLYLGMTSSGNRRFVPYTNANILKEMKKQGLVGKEGFDYGLSSLLAKFSQGQKNLKQLKETAKNELGSKEDLDKVWEDLRKEYDKLGEEVGEHYYNKYEFYEVQGDVFYAIAKNNKRALSNYGGMDSLPNELIGKVKKFIEKAKKIPRSYFEAKPMRMIDLDEFSHVIVQPDILTKKQKKDLQLFGIEIIETDRNDIENVLLKINNVYFQQENMPQEEFSYAHIQAAKQYAAKKIAEYEQKKKIKPNTKLTERQKRYRDVAYDILYTAASRLKDENGKPLVKSKRELIMLLGNDHKQKKGNHGLQARVEKLEAALSELDDQFTAYDGFDSSWSEFFSDTGMSYNTQEVGGDAELAMQALDVIVNKKYLDDEVENADRYAQLTGDAIKRIMSRIILSICTNLFLKMRIAQML